MTYYRLEAKFLINDNLLDWYAKAGREMLAAGKDISGIIMRIEQINAEQDKLIAAMKIAIY